jgi:hypothetical protein
MSTIQDSFFNTQWKPDEIGEGKKVILVKDNGVVTLVDTTHDKISETAKTALQEVAENLRTALPKCDFKGKTKDQLENFRGNLFVINAKIKEWNQRHMDHVDELDPGLVPDKIQGGKPDARPIAMSKVEHEAKMKAFTEPLQMQTLKDKSLNQEKRLAALKELLKIPNLKFSEKEALEITGLLEEILPNGKKDDQYAHLLGSVMGKGDFSNALKPYLKQANPPASPAKPEDLFVKRKAELLKGIDETPDGQSVAAFLEPKISAAQKSAFRQLIEEGNKAKDTPSAFTAKEIYTVLDKLVATDDPTALDEFLPDIINLLEKAPFDTTLDWSKMFQRTTTLCNKGQKLINPGALAMHAMVDALMNDRAKTNRQAFSTNEIIQYKDQLTEAQAARILTQVDKFPETTSHWPKDIATNSPWRSKTIPLLVKLAKGKACADVMINYRLSTKAKHRDFQHYQLMSQFVDREQIKTIMQDAMRTGNGNLVDIQDSDERPFIHLLVDFFKTHQEQADVKLFADLLKEAIGQPNLHIFTTYCMHFPIFEKLSQEQQVDIFVDILLKHGALYKTSALDRFTDALPFSTIKKYAGKFSLQRIASALTKDPELLKKVMGNPKFIENAHQSVKDQYAKVYQVATRKAAAEAKAAVEKAATAKAPPKAKADPNTKKPDTKIDK